MELRSSIKHHVWPFINYKRLLRILEGISGSQGSILGGLSRSPHLMQLASGIVGDEPSDDDEQYQRTRPQCVEAILFFSCSSNCCLCATVYTGCLGFDGMAGGCSTFRLASFSWALPSGSSILGSIYWGE